jgi:tetratricopeptide (TPR) repeat protein
MRVARAFAHLNRGDEEAARQAAEIALSADLPPADRADVTALLGAAALRRGDTRESVRRFEEALALARGSGDLVRVASALERLARARRVAREYPAARGALDECLTVRRRLGDGSGCGNVLIEIAALDEHDGRLVEAAARLREAVQHAATCDEPVIAARANLRLGRVLRDQGEWENARAAFQRAGNDDPDAAGWVALELALLDVAMRGAPEQEILETIEMGDRRGLRDISAQARIGLATLYRRRGRRDDARAVLRAVLIASGGIEDETISAARIGFAELAADHGRPDAAATAARLALASADRTGPAILVWRARRLLGTTLGQLGERAQAEAELHTATEAARSAHAYPELARCLTEWLAIRGGDLGDPAVVAMRNELRVIAAYLTGGPPPALSQAADQLEPAAVTGDRTAAAREVI